LNPPQHAAVFCVDEKSAIQALDRLTAAYLYHRGERNDMDSNITAMALYRCTQP